MASPERCRCDFEIDKLEERWTGHVNDRRVGNTQHLRVQAQCEDECDEKADNWCSMHAVDKKYRLVRLVSSSFQSLQTF
jgi:hypothetical protein